MPLSPFLSNVSANASADALLALLNGGKLRMYDGTQPANADTAISTQVLLAELTFGTPAFAAAVAGVALANSITPDTDANNTGTASWFRAFKSDGTTAIMDGSVGTSDANVILNSVSIVAGGTVSVASFSYTQAKS